MRLRRDAAPRIETGVETLTKLGEVLLQAPSGIRAAWIGNGDAHHRHAKQPFNLCHRCREPGLLALVERLQEGVGESFGSLIQRGVLRAPSLGELYVAHSSSLWLA